MPYFLSIFKRRTCILHHIAFLFCLPAHYFLCPITRFQPPESHFLGVVLPFSAMYFMSLRGYIYTIAVCFYAFWLAFSCIQCCIQHHFTLHLAPKRTAFSIKTHCVQHQNALRLAAYCTTFSSKQPKTKCKLRFYAMCIHFACIYHYPLFASEQTFARIDYLRSGGRLVTKKGTHNVKIRTENKTNFD